MLGRRACARLLLAGVATVLFHPGNRAIAQSATPGAPAAPDLSRLLLDANELPAGLELESSGTREEVAQLAGTFRNSRDAAQLLAGWGWLGNVYTSYVARAGAGTATPTHVEISLHRFATSTGAAYALSYFAHDRAVALQHQERLGDSLLPCEAMVTGDGAATRFLRRGNLVVRVTVVMPSPANASSQAAALSTATNLALAVLANAGSTLAAQDVLC